MKPATRSRLLEGSVGLRRALHHSLVAWLLAWILDTAQAQVRFDTWTTEEGLPQNSVLALAQSRDGYLWMATYNGLVRFDGERFTLFDKRNTPAFPTSRFQDIKEDAAGALWITFFEEEAGLVRYKDGQFTAFGRTNGLPANTIYHAHVAPDGALLLSTDQGIFWWRNERFEPYERQVPRDFVQACVTRSGTHWFADKGGVHEIRANGQVADYVIPVPPAILFRSKLLEDRSGVLWVAPPQGNGVYRLKDGRVVDFSPSLGLQAPVTVNKILETPDGSLWFGTLAGELARYSGDATGQVRVYRHADGLPNHAIRGLCMDHEGTIWIGTDGGGLTRMSGQFISGISEKDGLTGKVAHAVLEDRSGAVWVATQSGVGRIADGQVRFFAPGRNPGDLPHSGLQALHQDRSGRIWLGGFNGLCSFQDGAFSPPIQYQSTTMPLLNVWAIREDRAGNLWLGTHYGLIRYRDRVEAVYTTQNGLPHERVRALHEDRQGTFWLGTEGGLVRMLDDRFTTFTTRDGLADNRVWSFHEDADGVLWIGSFDGGLTRLKDGRFSACTAANGLADNGAFQILEDSTGNLWVSGYRGLYSVPKQQLNDFCDGRISEVTSRAHGRADGMLSSDCNGGRQPSGIRDRNGRLWFTTINGVAVVDPTRRTRNNLPPPVLIEEARIDNMPIPLGSGHARELRLLPGQANLELRYTALSFQKTHLIRFRYRLENQDDGWVEAGNRRTANYAHLRPGSYRFQVIAANADGVWNQTGAALAVTVVPPIHATVWFRTLAGLGVLGAVIGVYRLRVRQIQQQHAVREAFSRRLQESQELFSRRLIESQEAERKRVAAELHDGLGQSLAIIRNRALQSLGRPDDHEGAIEQIEEIADSAGQAILETREIAYSLRPFHIDRLGLTAALGAMLRRAGTDGLQFTSDIPPIDGLLAPESEISLYRIVQECVSNILKHSGASAASISIQPLGPKLELVVRDNGRGFAVPESADTPMDSQDGTGFGLLGLHERSRILGGSLQISSAPGEGTTIRLSIPVTRQPPTPGTGTTSA